jgi:hypothetical protein
MKPRSATAVASLPTGKLTRFVIAAAAVLIVALGLFPDSLARFAQQGAAHAAAPQAAVTEGNLPLPAVGGR